MTYWAAASQIVEISTSQKFKLVDHLTLPSGLSAGGLPLGTQVASAPFDEETLLASAHWCEQVLGFSLTPPVMA